MKKLIFRHFYSVALVIILLPFYFLLRTVFFFWNNSLFQWTDVRSDLRYILTYSLQIDLASIILINLPAVFLIMVSGSLTEKKKIVCLNLAYFFAVVTNVFGFILNTIDIGYFRYSKERSTVGLLSVFFDSMSSLGSIVRVYWPLFVLFLVFVVLLILLLNWFFKILLRADQRFSIQKIASGFLTFFLFFMTVWGWNSGVLMPATPLLKISAINLPLAQNSIHNFLYSLVRKQIFLQKKQYFAQETVNELIRTDRVMVNEKGGMIKKNVIIFILESFSHDYFDSRSPYRATTPFFDSLIGKSLNYPNAFANGGTSNQGIVAILAGLPPFMDEPFFYSAYTNTRMQTVGQIFKKSGYSTHFFLGAGEDHFGFGKFCKIIGIDHYYGRKAFNDDRYYDGNWGIFDEPFLQFGIKELNKKPEPFFSVFFTISSHPPFTIPEKHKEKFNYPGQTPAQQSISYVDYALRKFFDSCKNTDWFKNTLFVFAADHWLAPDNKAVWSSVWSTAIPIFIFDPDDPNGKTDSLVAGQVDIVPTILNKLHYTGHYTGFGRSLLDTSYQKRYVVNRVNFVHQVITDEFVLGYNEPAEKVQYLYNYHSDSSLKHNLMYDSMYDDKKRALKKIIQANIQQYNNGLLKRSLFNE